MSSYHTPPNDAKNSPTTPLAGSPTEPLVGAPAFPRTAEGLSTTVEDLFFSYPEMTPAQWQRCLDTRTVGPHTLADDTVAELRILVAELEDVTAGTEPAEEEQPKAVQTLKVAGRQGASYQLLDHLGTGGHSVVYRGLQAEPFERVVAIKVYYKAAESAEAIDQLREVQALKRLQHPGICPVLDAGITPWHQPFLAFELIEGRPLNEHLAAASPAFEARIRLFEEILDTVSYAHEQGVVHRDLKPDNLMVHTASGRATLIDFSISGLHDPGKDARTATAVGVGTFAYQSPEQAGLIGAAVDARTDIYSLGCILFELLAGERAFFSDSDNNGPPVRPLKHREADARQLAARLDTALAETEAPPPKPFCLAVGRIVERCVATSPESRFQTVGELQEALREAVHRPPGKPLSRRLTTQPMLAGAVGFALAITAAAGSLWLLHDRSSTQPTVAEQIFAPLQARVRGQASPAEAADARRRAADRWLGSATEQLLALAPDDQLRVGSQLLDLTAENGFYQACGAVAETLAAGRGTTKRDLLVRARLMTYRLAPDVASDTPMAVRADAETLLASLRDQQLLTTTPEGLLLVARFSEMLTAVFFAEGQAEAKALLAPLMADPESLSAVDPAAAAEVQAAWESLP